MKENTSGREGQGSAQGKLCAGINSWTESTPQISQGCRNLVPTPPHTTSGETLASAPWTISKRASSIGICLAN